MEGKVSPFELVFEGGKGLIPPNTGMRARFINKSPPNNHGDMGLCQGKTNLVSPQGPTCGGDVFGLP